MPIKKVLEELMDSVPGTLGAILADWEGEMVDQVARMDEYELKVVGATKGILLTRVQDALKRLRSSSLQEMVITTDQVQTLIAPVTAEYFLVLILRRDEQVLGRAMFQVKRCVGALKKEIE